jgi:DNA-binding beta-propeller fold protein YncE
MRRAVAFSLVLVCSSLLAQEIPAPTELMGQPFFIKKKWLIEVANHQDYLKDDKLGRLTLDPQAGKLFIAHGPQVEIIDIASGTLDGKITDLRGAQAIVLDSSGEYGYISDGVAGEVAVFDRSSQQIVDRIPSCPGPKALALEPQSGLLFAVCSSVENTQPTTPDKHRPSLQPRSTAATSKRQAESGPVSLVSVIDTERRSEVAIQPVEGKLGFAQADDSGRVYVAFNDRSGLLRIDAGAMGEILRGTNGAKEENPPLVSESIWRPEGRKGDDPPASRILSGGVLSYVPLGGQCDHPRALAVDSARERLFTACDNTKLLVTNADNGVLVTSLPISSGADSVGYDPNHRLIFAANGGGSGTLTIIHQHVPDSYEVVQNLPTIQKASTLALDPASGTVYLVVPFLGVSPENAPAHGKSDVAGNLMVLAISE